MNFARLTMPRPDQYQLTQLRHRHREIIRLSHVGLSARQISEQVGISSDHVGRVLNCDLAKEHMDTLEHMHDVDAIDAKTRIDALQGPALDLLEKIITGDIDQASISLRAKTCWDILDRGGNGKVSKVEGSLSGGYLVRVGVEEIKNRGRELGIIDVTPSGEEDCSPKPSTAPSPEPLPLKGE